MSSYVVGDYGIFNEKDSNDWERYENKKAMIVEVLIEDDALFIQFKDGFILEVVTEEVLNIT